MNVNIEDQDNDFRPRVIIWQLTLGDHQSVNGNRVLSQQECMLIIESIASVAKSIVVLTGLHLAQRADLYDIVAYGQALGLKIILETHPEELTEEVLTKYQLFGPRIFRVVLDGRIVEDSETRYRQSPEFLLLEDTVSRMKRMGFEIHFALNIVNLISTMLFGEHQKVCIAICILSVRCLRKIYAMKKRNRWMNLLGRFQN
jgi:hypothetical protein